MIMIMMMISSGQEKRMCERESESKEREERREPLKRGKSHRNKYKRAV